jgi:hypothetical protein
VNGVATASIINPSNAGDFNVSNLGVGGLGPAETVVWTSKGNAALAIGSDYIDFEVDRASTVSAVSINVAGAVGGLTYQVGTANNNANVVAARNRGEVVCGGCLMNLVVGQDYFVNVLSNVAGVVTITVSQSDAAPIPAAFPLFASGLGVIGFVARRRKRTDSAGA